MAETTKIQWADATWNPWEGCQRVSPGCINCYAEARDRRLHRGAHWGVYGARRRTSPANWKKPLAWEREAARTGVRPRVFPSLCDPFEDRPELEDWRADFFRLIRECPHIDWLLLTKRPELVLSMIPAAWRERWPANVWLGVSVEDSRRWAERLPHLARLCRVARPPVVFLSCEPLLERVELGLIGTLPEGLWPTYSPVSVLVDWVIVGGESGPHARPCRVEWIRALVRECQDAGVPAFVKQLGARPESVPDHISYRGSATPKPDGFYRYLNDPKGGDMAEWPEDLRVRQMPGAAHA